jgi:dTDP-4-dehydrorhamnose reductase
MTTQPTILVTGANGQLGRKFREMAVSFPSYRFIFLSREELPVHDVESIKNTFTNYHPQYCINCAAYTAVDKAESEKEQAYLSNAEGPGILAAACGQYNTRLIHISTDYVFAGTATSPYKEDEATEPQSVYGASKLEGERRIFLLNPEALVIRTSWVYSEFGKNFVKTMLRLMKERKELGIVNDQTGAPTWAADLAAAILQIIHSGKWEPGTYHFSNTGAITWFDFAVAIRDMTGSNCRINPITTAEYPTAAKRPAYSVLDTTKIETVFGICPRYWKDSLQQCLAKAESGQ